MPTSLFSVLPALARILNEPFDTLRTRQRALVAADALDSIPGRGPGSGVVVSGKTLAQFLIGSCVNIDVADTFTRMRSASGICPLTGAKTFVDAIAVVLANRELANRVKNIEIRETAGQGLLHYDDQEVSTFARSSANCKRGILWSTWVSGDMFRAIAAILT